MALRLQVTGRVQGVGFRPFVYRLAQALGIRGWVRNCGGRVEIHAEGPAEALEAFRQGLEHQAPPVARVDRIETRPLGSEDATGFRILPSGEPGLADVHLPPDLHACPDCLTELADSGDRRHRYPFTNCTRCGPRYTLIRGLPYDRARTSMAAFELCADCAAEYADPGDRRFHAEPVACPRCGPRLHYHPKGDGGEAWGEAALQAAVAALGRGAIVAVKGIGGYHLMCNATDDGAIERLRARKPRPHKPLALLFPDPEGPHGHWLEACVALSEAERRLLQSPVRPIVLARRRSGAPLPERIAPGLQEVGVMLPCSPLHHLLAEAMGRPLVATSGNVGGEPVLTDEAEAEARLARVADAFLHHDRGIERPADDAVCRTLAGRPRILRLGRGNAPLELRLPAPLPRPVLALGGQLKVTLCLAWGDRAVVSPHLADMGTPRALDLLARLAKDLQTLYGVTAEALLCDAHPDYDSHRWARDTGLPVHRIHHHFAHASALAGEHPDEEGDWLVFTWDGTGLGPDGTLWGGETLLGRPGRWRRVATLRPFRLPGGERAALAPWRSAAALCWETGREPPWLPPDGMLAKRAWEKGLNTPRSSAAGRLFDAAAGLLGLLREATFDGQAPMWLEAYAAHHEGEIVPLETTRREDGMLVADWARLVAHLLDSRRAPAERAADFHASLAGLIRDLAEHFRESTGVSRVGLTGGVFQNRLLCDRTFRLLEASGFEVRLPTRVPPNDGGLAFGQVIEHAARRACADAGRPAP